MKLYKKTIAFLGDSITEGAGTSGPSCRYDLRLKDRCGLRKVLNYGIGGTRIAYQSTPTVEPRYDLYFCGRAYDIDQSADIIVVFGGTNDYGHGNAPFGTFEDRTPATFCGAVDFLMRILRELHPLSEIVFMTPCRRAGDEQVSPNPVKLPEAKPLWEYVQVIVQKGAQYGIPVLDLYSKLDINPNREDDRDKYTVDGLHLNDAGHEKLAALLAVFLEEL